MKTNRQVIDAFYQQKSAKSRNLVSDGKSLWSHGWWECARWYDGKVWLRSGPSYSQSTSGHRPSAGIESSLETPVKQGEMRLGYGNECGNHYAAFYYTGLYCMLWLKRPRKNSYRLKYESESMCADCRAHYGLEW